MTLVDDVGPGKYYFARRWLQTCCRVQFEMRTALVVHSEIKIK